MKSVTFWCASLRSKLFSPTLKFSLANWPVLVSCTLQSFHPSPTYHSTAAHSLLLSVGSCYILIIIIFVHKSFVIDMLFCAQIFSYSVYHSIW